MTLAAQGTGRTEPCERPDSLVLFYGARCVARCEYCCHPAETFGDASLTPALAIRLIREAHALGHFGLIGVTGGEPWLYRDELLEILEAVRPLGLQIRIVTSAHWAKTPERALAELRPFVERGLTQLSVSTDPTHQRYVPRERAEHALAAAQALGLRTEVAAVFLQKGIALADVVTLPDGVHEVVRLAAPIGRARALGITPETYGLEREAKRFAPCGEEGARDLTVFPDGEAYPCCSGLFAVEAGLSVGNVHSDSLETLVARARAHRLSEVAHRIGWDAFYGLAAHRFPELFARLPPREPLVSTCNVCVALHGDPALREAIRPILDYALTLADTVDALHREREERAAPEGACRVGIP